MRQDSEAVGITLEMGDVVPELGRNFIFQSLSGTLAEESLDSFFAGMTEGRIAQIVRQAGCTHDGSYFLEERILQFRALFMMWREISLPSDIPTLATSRL